MTGTIVVGCDWIVSWHVTFWVMVGRITAIAVVITVGVVHRIHRGHGVRARSVTGCVTSRRRRRDHRAIAVIVVAVIAGTGVSMDSWTDVDNHPWLVVIAIPAESQWLEVLKGGEAVQVVAQLVVRHHRISPRRVRTISGDRNRHSLDPTRADSHVFLGVVITVVGVQVEVDVSFIRVITDIL